VSRLNQKLSQLKAMQRTALIPFITAGDPNPEFTVPALHAMVKAGADIIEVGVPFSDPMADGPVIQRASERALAHKMSLRKTLDLISFSGTPIPPLPWWSWDISILSKPWVTKASSIRLPRPAWTGF